MTAERVRPGRVTFAAAAYGLNPVVLFLAVGSGHNDLLVALVDHRRGGAAHVAAGDVGGGGPRPGRAREGHGGAAAGAGRSSGASRDGPRVSACGRSPHTPGWRSRSAWCSPCRTSRPTIRRSACSNSRATPDGSRRRCSSRRSSTSSASARWVGSRGSGSRITLVVSIVELARTVAARASAGDAIEELTAAIGWSLVLLMLLGPVLLPWYVVWALPVVWLLPRAPRATVLHGRRRPRDGAMVDRTPAVSRCVQPEPVARALGGHAGDVRAW